MSKCVLERVLPIPKVIFSIRIFTAYYLPRPSMAEYQFVYVDKTEQVCACSQTFTFCNPKPLEELETLKEEREEEDGEEELLLVVSRAQLLQVKKKISCS